MQKSHMDIEDSSPSKRPHILPYDFPNVWCPTHDRPIIFACIRPDCKYQRIFLCSKCVHHELAHVNAHTPLHIMEDFVEYIAKDDPPLLDINKNDSKGLVSDMDSNLSSYSKSVTEEQKNIKKILTEFNDVFQDKSEELITLLESQLAAHNEKLQERYQRLENELSTDDLENAGLMKFKEISTEVGKIRSSERQCDFLKQILKKRQAWEEASKEMKEYPRKSYEFYENVIAQQMDIEPKLQNKDQLIEIWNKGLNALIQKVLNQAQIGDRSLNDSHYISLNLETISDLELLTDEMLRPETLLCYKPQPGSKIFAADLADCLARLPSLRALALDFSLLPVTTDDLQKAISTLDELKQLRNFELNVAGVQLSPESFPEIVKKLKSCKTLTELSINLSQVGLSNFSELIEGIGELKFLVELNINLSGNKFDGASVEALIIAVRALKHLESLGLNLNGFSLSGSSIDRKAAFKLLSMFGELETLRRLSIGLGHANLNDDHVMELADSLKRIPSLRSLELVLNNNKIEDRGARKIAKALTKSHVNSLYLNVHSNDLGNPGVEELLQFLQDSRKWVKVEVNLRNVGLNRSQANAWNQQYAEENVKIIF